MSAIHLAYFSFGRLINNFRVLINHPSTILVSAGVASAWALSIASMSSLGSVSCRMTGRLVTSIASRAASEHRSTWSSDNAGNTEMMSSRKTSKSPNLSVFVETLSGRACANGTSLCRSFGTPSSVECVGRSFRGSQALHRTREFARAVTDSDSSENDAEMDDP